MKVRTTLSLVSLCTLLLTTSCEPGRKLPPKKQEILRLNLADDPRSLDPRQVRSIKDLTLVKQLFEGLTRLDLSGKPSLALAEEVELSPDLLTYTFRLRHTCWNNGDPVTAHHFAQAWKRALDPQFASDYAYILFPILHAQEIHRGEKAIDDLAVETPDAYTLVVHLHTPTPYFLELTAFPTYYPIHDQFSSAKADSSSYLCNGPFTLHSWTPQRELILEKNPLYWDADSVHLDALSFSIITDNGTENLLFEKGALDWLGQPTSHNISTDRLHAGADDAHSYPIAGTLWFTFNIEREPFQHLPFRKAFSYAINRQDIITHILQGNQQVATGLLPPSMALHPTPYFTDGDTERARELFEEGLCLSGYTRSTLPKIILCYSPSERNSKIAQLVQEQWQRAFGVPISLQSIDRQMYRLWFNQGRCQIGMGDWVADFHDPLAFLELFKYPNDPQTGSGLNPTGWQDPHFINLLNLSLVERDPQRRQELLHDAEKLLVAQMPIAPLYHYAFDYIKKEYVQGVTLSPLGLADFKQARISR